MRPDLVQAREIRLISSAALLPHRMMETTMQLKTTLLALAAGLTLAIPAAAMAQPFGYGYGYVRHDDGRWIEREREFRRAEAFRRMEWRREHAFRDYGYRGGYYGR
jgi:hypothetical protein